MKNPNAVVGVASAGVGGQIVLEVSSWLGWSISTGLAVWIAAGIAGVALFVGRSGVRGAWRRIMNGPAA